MHHLFAVWTSGGWELHFQHLASKPPWDEPARLAELIAKLSAIEGIELPLDAARRRPAVALSRMTDGGVEKALGLFDWVVYQVNALG